MEQYLDQKDGMWHITMFVNIPNIIVKNKLNFRIKEIKLKNNTIQVDPVISNSKHSFYIPKNMLNKKVFFNFKFDISEIKNINEFTIGLCDENVGWFLKTIIVIKNEFSLDNKNTFEKIENKNIDNLNLQSENIIAKQESVISDTKHIPVLKKKNLSKNKYK